MKKYLNVILLFNIGFWTVPVSAKQINMSSYYPSSNGSYTKIILINNGPSAPNAYPAGSGFCSQQSNGAYTNAGAIFVDPNSGFLEMCKGDGSFASFPGACFLRFTSAVGGGGFPCGNKAFTWDKSIPLGQPFPFQTNPVVYSYVCCNTNTNDPSPSNNIAQMGCFSLFSTSPSSPTCSSAEHDAYDMGCQSITETSSAGAATTIYKRDCCFNSGPNALGVSSQCP